MRFLRVFRQNDWEMVVGVARPTADVRGADCYLGICGYIVGTGNIQHCRLLTSSYIGSSCVHPVYLTCVRVRALCALLCVAVNNIEGVGSSYAEDQPRPVNGSVLTAVYKPDEGSLEFLLDGQSLGVAFHRSVRLSSSIS